MKKENQSPTTSPPLYTGGVGNGDKALKHHPAALRTAGMDARPRAVAPSGAYRTYGDAEACKQLWFSVIIQATRDATMRIGPKSDSTAIVWQNQARAWLRTNSEQFRDVCDLAGVDPSIVRNWWLEQEAKIMKERENAKRQKFDWEEEDGDE